MIKKIGVGILALCMLCSCSNLQKSGTNAVPAVVEKKQLTKAELPKSAQPRLIVEYKFNSWNVAEAVVAAVLAYEGLHVAVTLGGMAIGLIVNLVKNLRKKTVKLGGQ